MALEFAGDEWRELAIRLCRRWFQQAGPQGGLFEDARAYAMACGLWAPPSPNAWGAVTLTMTRRGTIVKTGEFRSSKSARSHYRAQPVWRLA